MILIVSCCPRWPRQVQYWLNSLFLCLPFNLYFILRIAIIITKATATMFAPTNQSSSLDNLTIKGSHWRCLLAKLWGIASQLCLPYFPWPLSANRVLWYYLCHVVQGGHSKYSIDWIALFLTLPFNLYLILHTAIKKGKATATKVAPAFLLSSLDSLTT